jgi:hypothetical protein
MFSKMLNVNKGGTTMWIKKGFMIIGLVAMMAAVGSGGGVLAGGPENPPTSGTIEAPELWGTMIIDCGARNLVILRVKRVVDCNVQTQAFVQDLGILGCPADETTPLYRKLGVTLFDINPDPAAADPIITKVKNFKQEPEQNLYSFDVQIKFWKP